MGIHTAVRCIAGTVPGTPASGRAGRRARFTALGLGLVSVLIGLLAGAAPAGALPPGPWLLPATNVSNTAIPSIEGDLAIGPDGSTTVIWHANDGSPIIQVSDRPPGGVFGPPTVISSPALSVTGPRIAIGADGTTAAVWRADGTIQATVRPPGGSFGPPSQLSAPELNTGAQQVAVAPDGTVLAAWGRRNPSTSIFEVQAAVRPPGGSFGAPVILSDPSVTSSSPRVAFDSAGRGLAVWQEPGRSGAGDATIRARVLAPGGGFGTTMELSQPGLNAHDPRVAIGPDDETVVAWTTGNTVQATSGTLDGGFGVAADLAPTGSAPLGPEAAIGLDGTAAVVWSRSVGGEDTVQAAIRTPGGSFAAPVDLSRPGADAREPDVAVSPDGAIVAAWEYHATPDRVIQATIRQPGGNFGTPVYLSGSGKNGTVPRVAFAPDATGIATVIWGWFSRIQAVSTLTPDLPLTTSTDGTGQGAVSSDPAGIDCGSTCAATFPAYTPVTLTATAAAGSKFSGWDGACSGTATTCVVTMNAVKDATATFTRIIRPTGTTGVFDGRKLHIRLKCGPQYRPECRSVAVPVTRKGRKGKPMAQPLTRRIRAGGWVNVTFRIKHRYRSKVAAMATRNRKTLFVRQQVRSKKVGHRKFRGKKPRTVYHRYRVRSAG